MKSPFNPSETGSLAQISLSPHIQTESFTQNLMETSYWDLIESSAVEVIGGKQNIHCLLLQMLKKTL